MLLIHSEEGGWEKLSEDERMRGMAAYNAYTQALEAAGILRDRNRLEASTTATMVRVGADGKTSVLDGPYSDTKEQLAGYYVVDVDDLDQAIAWAARCPGATYGVIEVRPVGKVTAAA
jgi:hypothetical protein